MAKAKSQFRKARNSSIYRGMERLLGDLMQIAERIPKHSYGLQAVGCRMINEAIDAMAVTEYALNASDINQRIAYIGSLIHSMTIIKSTCRQLYGYSRKDAKTASSTDGEIKLVNTPNYGRIISNAQYAGLLASFGKLSLETGKWFKASQTIRLKGMGKANV
jgi:hypothetical protein